VRENKGEEKGGVKISFERGRYPWKTAAISLTFQIWGKGKKKSHPASDDRRGSAGPPKKKKKKTPGGRREEGGKLEGHHRRFVRSLIEKAL